MHIKYILKQFAKKIPCLQSFNQYIKSYRKRKQMYIAYQFFDIREVEKKVRLQLKNDLANFFKTNQRIVLPSFNRVDVSVIVPVHNKAEFTYACLRSLQSSTDINFEVIIVDNASIDETKYLLERIDNVQVIRNEKNLNFVTAFNQGALVSKADYLLFIHNDTLVKSDSIAHAYCYMIKNQTVGAVGAKLVYPNNAIDEAGGIVFRDGTARPLHKGIHPRDGVVNFRKQVHYCSHAFLMTLKHIFLQLGMFDRCYEIEDMVDVDYCINLYKHNHTVYYLPEVEVTHVRFSRFPENKTSVHFMTGHANALLIKHHDYLSAAATDDIHYPLQKDKRNFKKRILYIDETVPKNTAGAGFPRANSIIHAMLAWGCFVSVYPLLYLWPDENWQSIRREVNGEIEILAFGAYGIDGIAAFMESRGDFYDCVWISRPSTMLELMKINPSFEMFKNQKIIYDAEAIFALREIIESQLFGIPISEVDARKKIQSEISLAANADIITSVSDIEAGHFKILGKPVEIVSFVHTAHGNSPSFKNRSDILFVGAIHNDATPNADSIIYFINEIFPKLKDLGYRGKFYVVGTNYSNRISSLQTNDIIITGAVEDIEYYYNTCRVFVAPTRFAAGIPFKVTEASSYGLPCVITEILDAQLQWKPDIEYLVGHNPDDFAKKIYSLYNDENLWSSVSQGASDRIKMHYTQEKFNQKIDKILGLI